MSEEVKQNAQPVKGESHKPVPTFTQAGVDRIVKERIERGQDPVCRLRRPEVEGGQTRRA